MDDHRHVSRFELAERHRTSPQSRFEKADERLQLERALRGEPWEPTLYDRIRALHDEAVALDDAEPYGPRRGATAALVTSLDAASRHAWVAERSPMAGSWPHRDVDVEARRERIIRAGAYARSESPERVNWTQEGHGVYN